MSGERPNFSIVLGAKKAHFYLEREDGVEQANVTVNQTGLYIIPPSLSTFTGPHILTPPLITRQPSLCVLHCSLPLLTRMCGHSLSRIQPPEFK